MAFWRISVDVPSEPLIRAGLLPAAFFRHNTSIEILRVYAFQPREQMFLVRVTRAARPWTEAQIARQREALRRRYRLRDFEVVEVGPDGRTYVALLRQATPGILEDLLEELGAGITPIPPTVVGRERAVLTFVTDEEAEKAILGLLATLRVPFELRSRSRVRRSAAETGGDLTARQREVLSLAWNLGYFDIPARVGLDKIASLTGMSRNTVSQHLRRGLRRILRERLG
ncbi:MAG TPA: helix-turn-helix domain-containing protein [Thermoplasmata archaeon]|nr:helix-turn-helix domain-containing protein [Thermoplasmata archaeon]